MASQRFRAEVLSNVQATPTVWLVELSTKNAPDFDFLPGQFVMVHTTIEGKKYNKSYSISSSNSIKGKIELCIKKVLNGKISNWLCSLKKGEEIEISGPYGLFVLKYPLERDIIFAATGTGLSAIKSMADNLFENGTSKEIWLFLGVRNEEEVLYREEFESLSSKYNNFHFVPVLSRSTHEWNGEKGYVQEFLKKIIEKHQNYDLYICGVVKAVDEIKEMALQMGFPKERIHFEKYT